jgi:hypothetical protein
MAKRRTVGNLPTSFSVEIYSDALGGTIQRRVHETNEEWRGRVSERERRVGNTLNVEAGRATGGRNASAQARQKAARLLADVEAWKLRQRRKQAAAEMFSELLLPTDERAVRDILKNNDSDAWNRLSSAERDDRVKSAVRSVRAARAAKKKNRSTPKDC